MKKTGRPPLMINWQEFDKLVACQLTQIELAYWFGCSVDGLDNACRRDRGESLSDIYDKRRLFGEIRIKKRQFEIMESNRADAGTMAIFLGKVKLGQNDRAYEIAPQAPLGPGATTPKMKSFTEFCLAGGYHAPYPKQIEMMEFGLANADPRLLLGARGYGKTDFVTVAGVAYDIYCAYLEGLFTSNLIITKSKTRNTAIIEEIAHLLKANGVELEKENSTCIRVKGQLGKDHSVEVLTIKSSFRGRHPKRIVMDDPVTEEDTSEAMRTLVKKKYDEAYKLCKNIVIIGQPAHAHDLYAELRPQLKKLEVPHGQIPELDADLEAMKLAGVDTHSIEMSYHLRIPQDGASIFANLKFIDRFPAGESVAMIDPSEGGDFTALSCIKAHFSGVAVVGKVWKRAWYHCLDEIVAELKARNVKKVCFETNKHGGQPLEQLRSLFKKLGLEIGVIGKFTDTNKEARIESAGSYSHLIHLSKESDPTYTKQVTTWEYKAKYDDAPDSLATGLEWLGLIRVK